MNRGYCGYCWVCSLDHRAKPGRLTWASSPRAITLNSSSAMNLGRL